MKYFTKMTFIIAFTFFFGVLLLWFPFLTCKRLGKEKQFIKSQLQMLCETTQKVIYDLNFQVRKS